MNELGPTCAYQPKNKSKRPCEDDGGSWNVWAGLSCALLVLLVISAVFNIRQFWSCRGNHNDWTYSYHQLREMNGNVDVPDMYETCDLYHPDPDVDTTHNEIRS
ncbi:unnamed protein product [Ranitomeya imitator]|uniref:Uncharacterized protein n=1 Tax=Ranitomeya imitator TaxID=111125 RepID=A0ABN9LKH7_9NEOB|nr:unnamed protein product [Ranitomeya imitator]